MNLVELDRALKKLRLGGMAAILETRLQQARSERMAPIDLISTLVQDELTRRADRLLDRRRKQAAFRDPDKRLDSFEFRLQQEDAAPPRLRARHWPFHLRARGRALSRTTRHRQESSRSSHRPGRHPARLQGAPEAYVLLEELADATLDDTRKQYIQTVTT